MTNKTTDRIHREKDAHEASFSSAWQEIRYDIQLLDELDLECAVHAATAHEYAFRPCLTETELEALGQSLHIELPPELVYVYGQIGDGGVGPDWGLYPGKRLSVVRAPAAADRCLPGLADADLLCIARRYYDWCMYLVCSGALAGHVVGEYEEAYWEEGSSLADVYRKWLDRELKRFLACQRLIDLSSDIEEIWRRRSEVLRGELEDEHSHGEYCEQGWLFAYTYSLLAHNGAPPLPSRTERDPTNYVQRSDVKQVVAELIRAHKGRDLAAQAAEDPSARALLLMRVQDPCLNVRLDAVRALAPLAITDPLVRDVLLSGRRESSIHDVGTTTLARLQPRIAADPALWPILLSVLGRACESVQEDAVAMLCPLAPVAPSVRAALLARLRDPGWHVPNAVRLELLYESDERALSALADTARTDPEMRAAVLDRLTHPDAMEQEKAEYMRDWLERPKPPARLWEDVTVRVWELKRLDVDRLLYAGENHNYEFAPRLSIQELVEEEQRLGFRLPFELAYVYTTVGNGGVGPYDGLRRAQTLSRWSPLAEVLERYGEEEDTATKVEAKVRGWFTDIGVDLNVSSLVCIFDRVYDGGCLHETFIVCGGPSDGALIGWDHGVSEPYRDPGNLGELYLRWLNREIDLFRLLRKMALASDDIEEIWRNREAFAGGDPMQVLMTRHDYYDDTYRLSRGDGFVLLLESALGEEVLTDDELGEFCQLDWGRQEHISPETRSKFREAIHRFRVRLAAGAITHP